MKGNNISSFLLLISPLLLVLVLFFSTFVSANDHTSKHLLSCLTHHSKTSSSISNVIYVQSNSSFTSVLEDYIQYSRFLSPENPKPLAIVTALNIAHVQATLSCARKLRLEVRIRSGGHDFEGLSFLSKSTYIILDLFKLNKIEIDIDNEMAWVQAGATVGELYYYISKASKTHAFPAGYWSTIAVGGHISGGGYGILLRKYGLAADQVLDAMFIDANGRILNRISMGEDLFWALKGGGGGNFGVVVAWQVKLVQVPERLTSFKVTKSLEEEGTTSLVHKWQSVAATLVEDVSLALDIMTITSSQTGQKTILFIFDGIFLGDTEELVSLMQTSFPELGVKREDCTEMSWIETVLSNAMFAGQQPEIFLNRSAPPRFYTKGLSDFVTSPISVAGLQGLWEYLLQIDIGAPLISWHPFGGKMAEIQPATTPYPHRAGNLYMMFNAISWDGKKLGAVSTKHIEWLYGMYDYLEPHVSKNPRSAYVNYRDLRLGVNKQGDAKGNYERAKGGWGNQYFKKNFDKLVRVKQMVDPENFFRNEQSIPLHPYDSMSSVFDMWKE